MTSPSEPFNTPPADPFAEAANHWDLERLYAKLTEVKQDQSGTRRQKQLTPVEKACLRGLLCECKPDEIAAKLHREPKGLRVELTRGLYRYVEMLTGRESNELQSYSDIPTWLEQAGYKRLAQWQDWGEAPELSVFYDRVEELETLEKWICDRGCRIVALRGIGGIGKTALAVTLAKQLQERFECIIWRSLRHRPPLNLLLADWIQLLSPQPEPNFRENTDDRISLLVDYLRQQRCLLVLDGLEAIMREGDRAGQYRDEYRDYGELFQRLGTERHQSCLLLTTWETPRTIELLETKQQPVRSSTVNGLGKQAARQWFEDRGLSDPEDWNALHRQYGGNPLALNIVVSRIQEFFGGSVSQFFTLDTILIGDPFKELLHQQFNRLSEPEKKIMYYLASQEGSVSIQQLRDRLKFESGAELIEALNSLRGRSLIEKATRQETHLALQQLVRRYLVREHPQECDRFKSSQEHP